MVCCDTETTETLPEKVSSLCALRVGTLCPLCHNRLHWPFCVFAWVVLSGTLKLAA
jgi:hypothetical protein